MSEYIYKNIINKIYLREECEERGKEWKPRRQSFLLCKDKLSWKLSSSVSCLLIEDEELSSVPKKKRIK